ncbi:MAG: YggS family pyridoxal phosphate-dependent enzyme [SAR324 cluster bacterium]|nr:YggS family pyridoxal phosphate-dependent enzyme [SAR324 cluster bacterium]
MSTFSERLNSVEELIRESSPHPEKVTLISVSKRKPLADLLEAYASGVRVFGENRVQEARDKRPELPGDAEIHLIGPLQKNKAKYCPTTFTWVHSLHSLEVAIALDSQFQKAEKILNVLVQMNLTGEETKSGLITFEELKNFNDKIVKLPNLNLRGLMTMGNPAFTPAENRPIFAKLREMMQKEQARLHKNDFNQLSMGMSGDFIEALGEGATMIRVGSALFGSRE